MQADIMDAGKEASRMVDLSKFKTFDFSEGVPYVSVTSNGLTFNKSVIMKMNYPPYVQLLINEEDKQIALQICQENDEKAVSFYREKANGVLSVRWNSKDLIQTVARLCGWDLKNKSYRVPGIMIPDASLMLFEMTDATEMV